MDDTELVTCLLCGIERYSLGKHLSSVHHITTKEYKEKFPDAKLQPNEVLKKFINALSLYIEVERNST